MFYQEAIRYLNSLINYERDSNYAYSDLKLERMKELLERLGNPQDKFKSLHVAGTKGKGSTCAFLFSILKEAGYKVGLYTSPHLIDFKERIKISYQDTDGETRERLIDQKEVAQIIEQIKAYADEIPGLTFFEITTALAFKFFEQKNIDFAVLETGLGGRLDATNVVTPLVCGISSIGLDHTALLGETIDKIAREKAGIIKDNGLVVSVGQPPQAWKEITNACKEKNARLYEIGRDFICDPIGQDLEGSIFDFKGKFDSYQNLKIPLLGQFQMVNVGLALGMIQLLRLYDIVISLYAIKKGLEDVHWPGRMHLVHRKPFILLDGAQNALSAQALRAAISMLFIPKKSILIFGVSKDKDVESMINYLCRGQNLIILTEAQTPRAFRVEELEKKMEPFKKIIKLTKTVEDAIKLAIENVNGPDDLITITGSIYIVGEAYQALRTLKFTKFAQYE
ncbi:MAG: bifunctional folylpolyglutamate synthase/dihydrofolate synthase [Candidatus Omnitrophica bacterium]|nr:bifunctional folylpolyglutamate synthase/dihydrofolate synthase [Candidatus Omnitrophota bacterium]